MVEFFQIKNHAASVIQAAARRYLALRRLARQALSALCIQRVWRGHQGRQLARKLRLEKVYQAEIQAVGILQVGKSAAISNTLYFFYSCHVNTVKSV